MKSFKRILCVIDLDEAGDQAILQADQEARFHGARLSFVLAVPYVDRSSVLFPQFHEKLALDADALERDLLARLTERVTRLTARKPEEFEIMADAGNQHTIAVRKAEEMNADLVVVSSPKPGEHAREWFGSAADRIVRYAHCPVLVVRKAQGGDCVIAATDFSDPSYPALDAAAVHARLSKRRLILLHSLELLRVAMPVHADLGPAWPPFTDAEIKEFTTKAEMRLQEALKKTGSEGETVISMEPAATAILQLATDRKADRIVVGTTGRTGLPRLVLGSVAEEVVREAPCSVLVVRLHS